MSKEKIQLSEGDLVRRDDGLNGTVRLAGPYGDQPLQVEDDFGVFHSFINYDGTCPHRSDVWTPIYSRPRMVLATTPKPGNDFMRDIIARPRPTEIVILERPAKRDYGRSWLTPALIEAWRRKILVKKLNGDGT
jgi:hypothetical protein